MSYGARKIVAILMFVLFLGAAFAFLSWMSGPAEALIGLVACVIIATVVTVVMYGIRTWIERGERKPKKGKRV